MVVFSELLGKKILMKKYRTCTTILSIYRLIQMQIKLITDITLKQILRCDSRLLNQNIKS